MTIKNAKELEAEKKRLQQRKKYLEKAIRLNWIDMKATLDVRSFVGNFFERCSEKKEDKNENFFSRSFSQAAESWMEKLVKRLEEKFARVWDKKEDKQ